MNHGLMLEPIVEKKVGSDQNEFFFFFLKQWMGMNDQMGGVLLFAEPGM